MSWNISRSQQAAKGTFWEPNNLSRAIPLMRFTLAFGPTCSREQAESIASFINLRRFS